MENQRNKTCLQLLREMADVWSEIVRLEKKLIRYTQEKRIRDTQKKLMQLKERMNKLRDMAQIETYELRIRARLNLPTNTKSETLSKYQVGSNWRPFFMTPPVKTHEDSAASPSSSNVITFGDDGSKNK